MPTTTLDRECPSGSEIPIEERPPLEVRSVQGTPIAPDNIPVWNPSFDVTPAHLISGWVTEFGIWQLPFPAETQIGQND
jgi:methylthioribose-1-phosphate isomerase